MKIIKFDNCYGCSFCKGDYTERVFGGGWRCYELNINLRDINILKEIHPDCPLEDYKEIKI